MSCLYILVSSKVKDQAVQYSPNIRDVIYVMSHSPLLGLALNYVHKTKKIHYIVAKSTHLSTNPPHLFSILPLPHPTPLTHTHTHTHTKKHTHMYNSTHEDMALMALLEEFLMFFRRDPAPSFMNPKSF